MYVSNMYVKPHSWNWLPRTGDFSLATHIRGVNDPPRTDHPRTGVPFNEPGREWEDSSPKICHVNPMAEWDLANLSGAGWLDAMNEYINRIKSDYDDIMTPPVPTTLKDILAKLVEVSIGSAEEAVSHVESLTKAPVVDVFVCIPCCRKKKSKWRYTYFGPTYVKNGVCDKEMVWLTIPAPIPRGEDKGLQRQMSWSFYTSGQGARRRVDPNMKGEFDKAMSDSLRMLNALWRQLCKEGLLPEACKCDPCIY
jgi:hypothetical protein